MAKKTKPFDELNQLFDSEGNNLVVGAAYRRPDNNKIVHIEEADFRWANPHDVWWNLYFLEGGHICVQASNPSGTIFGWRGDSKLEKIKE